VNNLENKDGGGKCVQSDENGSCAVASELENNDGVDKCHLSDDDGSCGVDADPGSKLECSAEVKKDDGITRELESDIICPLKRRKTEENCEDVGTENEGLKVIFYFSDYSLRSISLLFHIPLHSILVELSFILLKQV
jgi:hypothetical protein